MRLRLAGRAAESSPPAHASGPGEGLSADLAGRSFARLTALPALLVMAWLVPGVALLLTGRFLPVPMVLIAAPLAVIVIIAALREVPGHWPSPVTWSKAERDPALTWTAWWGLGGTIAVVVGFAAWQILLNSPQIIVLRDPGAVFQVGYWIAEHGSLPIPQSLIAFGGTHPGLTFSSTGFTAQGTALTPQFAAGLPVILAGGWWVHGISSAAQMSPLLGALAVLTFGGLAGRLVGPVWAPVAAVVLALTLPEQYTSRSAFSEPLIQVLLFGGLCLIIDALVPRPTRRAGDGAPGPLRWPAWFSPAASGMALGGFALGLTVLASVGPLGSLIAAIPFLGVLVAGHRPRALPLGIGLLTGAGFGLVAGYLLAPAYLSSHDSSLRTLGLIAVAAALVALAAVGAANYGPVRSRVPRLVAARPLRWLPEAVAALTAAAVVGFAVRPYVQTVHGEPGPATVAYVAALQRLLGLPIDPTRTYAEDSLYWVIWYIGLPAVLLGGCGLALLARRCLRALLTWRDTAGTARVWALPLMIIGWTTAAVLWMPATVPDQPWASRRLVPVVLPGLILCALWVSAWLVGRARERGAGPLAVSAAAACFAVALVVPTAVTLFGIGVSHSGPNGAAEATASGMALQRTGQGEAAAVTGICSMVGPETAVIILDRVAAAEFSQVIRGMCGASVGVMAGAPRAEVQTVLQSIVAAGRHPALLASLPAELVGYRATPRRVLDLNTSQEAHELTQPPTTTWAISYTLWLSEPGSSPSGA